MTHPMSDQRAERYRHAAENALRNLDWCVSYFRKIHKRRIAAQLARNAAHIRRSLLHETRTPAERAPQRASSRSPRART